MGTTKLMTAEDLMQMPDNGNRYDLIEGVLHTMSPAGWEHGRIVSALGSRIARFVEEHRLGVTLGAETGFLFDRDPDTVLAPDYAFVRADRLPPRERRHGFAPVAPDLVVEIVSPSNRQREVMAKMDAYLVRGVSEIWLVDPVRYQMTVFRPDHAPQVFGRNDVLDDSDVIPGFSLHLCEIFPDD